MLTSFVLSLGLQLVEESDNLEQVQNQVSKLECNIHERLESSISTRSIGNDENYRGEDVRKETNGFVLDGLTSAEFFMDQEVMLPKDESLIEKDPNRYVIPISSLFAMIVPLSFGSLGNFDHDQKLPPINGASTSLREITPEEVNEFVKSIHPSLTNTHFLGIITVMGKACSDKDHIPVSKIMRDRRVSNTGAFKVILLLNKIDKNSNPLYDELNGEVLDSPENIVIQAINLSKVQLRVKSCAGYVGRSLLPQVPSCPVCLHRIDPRHFGMSDPKSEHTCSKFCALEPYFNRYDGDFSYEHQCCQNRMRLKTWPSPFYCFTCDAIDRYSNLNRVASSFQPSMPSITSSVNTSIPMNGILCCTDCQMTQTLWVCMTCGFVGCGRYTYGHASKHYQETNHPCSLELVTQRIWDYASDTFIHRRDLLDCPLYRKQAMFADAMNPGIQIEADNYLTFCGTLEGESNSKGIIMMRKPPASSIETEDSHKKTKVLSAEYEVLLQSAIEEQAMHYEALIAKMCSDLAAASLDTEKITDHEATEVNAIQSDIQLIRKKIEGMTGTLVSLRAQQTSYQGASKQLIRDQNAMKDKLLDLQKEATCEQKIGEAKSQELEQQISDLSAFVSMRQQISNDLELREAQIVSTVLSPSSKPKRKLSSKKKGRRR